MRNFSELIVRSAPMAGRSPARKPARSHKFPEFPWWVLSRRHAAANSHRTPSRNSRRPHPKPVDTKYRSDQSPVVDGYPQMSALISCRRASEVVSIASRPLPCPNHGLLMGNTKVTVVPAPGWLLISTLPPVCWAKLYTILRPRPVPLPGCLVV